MHWNQCICCVGGKLWLVRLVRELAVNCSSKCYGCSGTCGGCSGWKWMYWFCRSSCGGCRVVLRVVLQVVLQDVLLLVADVAAVQIDVLMYWGKAILY